MRATRTTLATLLLAVSLAACTKEPGPGEPVKITVTKNGYEPFRVRAYKGQPLTLVVTRTTDETCATEIVIPEANLNVPLPLGKPVTVTFTPARSGEIRYSCAMKMLQGVIDVK